MWNGKSAPASNSSMSGLESREEGRDGQAVNIYHLKTKLAQRDKRTDVIN